MKRALLLDTSIGSDNKGDDIIMECVRKELAPVLDSCFVRNLPTHVSPFHCYQVWRGLSAVESYAASDYKFVGGSNLLVPNLTTYYPQWNVNIFNYRPLKGCVLVGVGAGAGAERGSDWHTRYVYKHMLNTHYYHSVRDERSKHYVEKLGLKAINTGCVTMWALTPEFCRNIPAAKSPNVVFTLTSGYGADVERDQWMIDLLCREYDNVYFWPQCLGDFEYFEKFNNIVGIRVLKATKAAYDDYLTNMATDYVGTRLHGGIYAMRHSRRAIVIAIDERARAINEKNHLNCIDRNEINLLSDKIQSDFATQVVMDQKAIAEWKSQFAEFE